jgi:hypothetical protein
MVATAKSGTNEVAAPSRREFLNYALGASVLLACAGTCAGLGWFTNEYQRPIAFTEQNSYFSIDLETLPQPGELPVNLLEMRTWLVTLKKAYVLYMPSAHFMAVCRSGVIRITVLNARVVEGSFQ